ncbi:hypothetical protein HDA40_001239 [Hamadaea flava]|uniref:Uncharacterized protein n=1 Tax=Hamadaea flava TaxID=1742688 RepID=A0ABV8LQQ4_9ACTN|nr:hypothetical protein [Hamadaea flava]MCP2322732.1 hypothetical protein [Hamadaea flava]
MTSPGEPSGDPTQHTSAVETAVRQIEETADQLVEDFDSLIQQFADNVVWLTPVIGATAVWLLQETLQEIRVELDAVLDIAGEVLAHYTPVISLINISFHWLTAVKQPVSGMVPMIQQYATENLAYWEGGTANHYKQQVLPPQVGAAGELAAKAGFISEWLYAIAQANVEYAAKFSEVISAIAGDVAQAAVKAGTVIDIPFAISDLASIVKTLVQSGMDNLAGIGTRIVEAGENVRQIVSDRVDESKFPGGAWPQAVQD